MGIKGEREERREEKQVVLYLPWMSAVLAEVFAIISAERPWNTRSQDTGDRSRSSSIQEKPEETCSILLLAIDLP